MNRKRTIIILGLIIFIILMLFYLIDYKTQKFGNNISKSTDDIVDNILNLSSYEASLEVTIESNKTTNKYKIKQLYSKPNIIKQIIEEPNNLENLTIIYDGKNMKLENSKLSLSKIYEEYEYISKNTLWLSSFIDNYSNKSKISETDIKIIIENENMYNNYNIRQELYIDKHSGLPSELKIYDNNQNTKIYIKYNEIKLNM